MPSFRTERFGVSAPAAAALESALNTVLDGVEGAPDAHETLLLIERFLERARDAGALLDWLAQPKGAAALARLAYAAPFLVRHLTAYPERLAGGVLAHLERETPPLWREPRGAAFVALDEPGAMAALRHWKYDRYVRLTARGLLGLDDAAATCAAVSRVAEGVIRAALAYAFAEQARKHGLPVRADGRLAGIAVVGMGKLGGGELNYSSDIDLILVHDGDEAECCRLPDGVPLPAPDDPTAEDRDLWKRWETLTEAVRPPDGNAIANGEFFQRLGRQTLRLLSVKTEHGLCFRTDADLRPNGRSGLLVPSLGFATGYYREQGREWERTALLKARCVAGSPRVRSGFTEAIRPFVYRRYLDFSAVEGVALIKHDLDRQQGESRDSSLKLGQGGIRECEFLVQAQQLLHGGRIAGLQVPGQATAVRALVDARLMEPGEADSLMADYWSLRNAENRVQMLDEAQVHALPEDPSRFRRALTAFSAGFDGRRAEAALAGARARIADRYRRFFARLIPVDGGLGRDWKASVTAYLPPPEADAARDQVDGLLNRLMRTRAGERCIFKLERLLARPELYGTGTEPAFPRWLALFEQIGNRNALFTLLEAHPDSLAWASRIFAEGGRHAPPLIRHPEFFESFVTLPSGNPGDRNEAAPLGPPGEGFRRILDAARDDEEFLLDLQTANAHARLRILSAYLEREDAAAQAGNREGSPTGPSGDYRAQLSLLADAAVDVCARHAWRSLVPRFGLPEGAAEGPEGELRGFAVLALGKLGSREMRFGSDADLVFVFRGEGTTGKGRTHLEFYTKLAQKLTALVSAPTQFGVLLDLDHRLRPFGRKGLLVPSLAAYGSFLAREAEVWNFQAFTRARHLCGEADLSRGVLERVARAWRRRRTPPQDVAREVLDMARRLVAQSPPSGQDRLQLKYALGGMLGFEFLRQCHFLLVRQAADEPSTSAAGGATAEPAETAGVPAGCWTPLPDHESIARLSADYETLSALDERASFYVEPFRHEVGPDTFLRFSGIGRRWSYEQIRSVCRRMQESIEASFRHLGA